MNALFLYDSPILPDRFKFPGNYLELATGHGVPCLEPWNFLFLDMPSSLKYYGAMLQKYPDKPLIPFAIIDDRSGLYNDGYVVLACFDGDDKSGDPKVYFHDYSKSKRANWDERYSLPNFGEWLRVAEGESARYMAERVEEDE
ncbi:MAG: hypothetical protein WKG03_03420 [Telluria sp.]